MALTAVTETPELIPFLEAEARLRQRFPDMTMPEFAMWAFLGQKASRVDGQWCRRESDGGGFTSYFNESGDASSMAHDARDEDLIFASLMPRHFCRKGIDAFQPSDRWLTYECLLQRWTDRIGAERARTAIQQCADLEPLHPLTGIAETRASAVYSLTQIEAIEQTLFANVPSVASANGPVMSGKNLSSTAASLPVAKPGDGTAMPIVVTHSTKHTRHDVLDPLIDQGIKKFGYNAPVIYEYLRELAIAGEPPFNHEGKTYKTLWYTDHNNKVVELTYSALRQRIKRRESKQHADHPGS